MNVNQEVFQQKTENYFGIGGDEVDWSKVEVDTKVLVRNPSISKSWSKAYFAKYKDGNVYVYDGGKTSWSGGLITYWAEAKLYKEDE